MGDAATYDDEPYGDDERCPDCDLVHCICDGAEEVYGRCRECETWGAIQCSVHGDMEIEALRAEHEHYATLEAINTLLAMPDAHGGEAWQLLQRAARRVLMEIGGGPECTGLTAGWCPRCGDCTCPDREQAMDDAACPLHGSESAHATEVRRG